MVVGVVACSVFGVFYATRIFVDSDQIIKSHVARVKVDMCLLESRLRDYRDIHHRYPIVTQTIEGFQADSDHVEEWQSMMFVDDATQLDTDISFGDPLRKIPNTFDYQFGSDGQSYIITSYGPDGDSDIEESLYTGAGFRTEPDRPLTAAWRGADHPLPWYLYDPSNGLISDGDIAYISP